MSRSAPSLHRLACSVLGQPLSLAQSRTRDLHSSSHRVLQFRRLSRAVHCSLHLESGLVTRARPDECPFSEDPDTHAEREPSSQFPRTPSDARERVYSSGLNDKTNVR